MKVFENQKIEQKVQKYAPFFDLSKIFSLYEAEKKISFLEKNVKAAEKALNNKEALKERAPMHVVLKSKSNNSKELSPLKVNCLKQRIDPSEKPEHYNRPFKRKHSTKIIFFHKLETPMVF